MIRVLVVGEDRVVRESVCEALARRASLAVVGSASSSEEAAAVLADQRADVVVIDATMARTFLGRDRRLVCGVPVVVFRAPEGDAEIVALAEAGVAGYVDGDGSLTDLVDTIEAAARGELRCSAAVAGALQRRLAAVSNGQGAKPETRLTRREREIVALVGRGLCDKEIARELSIELRTVKNHVHNLLKKLGVHRRADAAALVQRSDEAGRPVALRLVERSG